MIAVILAAGLGKRMHPLTKNFPKPMLAVHGEPILEKIINSLPEKVNKIILVVGFKHEVIEKYFGKKYKNIKIKYVYQKKQSGTWDALKLAKNFLKEEKNFLLLNADDLHDKKSLRKMINYKNSILVHKTDSPQKFGIVEKDSKNFLINIEEKPIRPRTNMAATGVYCLENKIFNFADPQDKNGELFLTDVLKEYAKHEKIKVIESDLWLPIGTPEDFIEAHNLL
jgi:NDP-sugar pyrophosphorylase family protein